MLVIRLFRIGRKNRPAYKIVVTQKTKSSKGGRFVAEVGSWDPLTKKRILKKEEIKSWISKGAQPSATIYNMLVDEKVVEGKKMAIPIKKSKKKIEAKPANETPKPVEAAAGGIDKKA